MTFNEAVREVQLISMNGLDDMSGEDAIRLINMLREEYVPTAEMTKSEKNNILSSKKYGLSFINFYADVMHQSTAIKFGAQTTPELYKYFSESQLMQAWLHPETIKVIGEKND